MAVYADSEFFSIIEFGSRIVKWWPPNNEIFFFTWHHPASVEYKNRFKSIEEIGSK